MRPQWGRVLVRGGRRRPGPRELPWLRRYRDSSCPYRMGTVFSVIERNRHWWMSHLIPHPTLRRRGEQLPGPRCGGGWRLRCVLFRYETCRERDAVQSHITAFTSGSEAVMLNNHFIWHAFCVRESGLCPLGVAGSAGAGGEFPAPRGAAFARRPRDRAAGLRPRVRPAPRAARVTGRGETVEERAGRGRDVVPTVSFSRGASHPPPSPQPRPPRP